MKLLAVWLVLLVAVMSSPALAQDAPDLTQLTLSDSKEEAVQELKQWLDARGFESELRGDVLVMRRGGVLMNVVPIVYANDLDRLRIASFYHPQDEFKNTADLFELAGKLNTAQNFVQVFIDGDGDLAAAGNMTFYDTFSAREFDAYVELFAAVVRDHILTEEAVKMLK